MFVFLKSCCVTDQEQIVARGPAVVGDEAALGVIGTFRDDHTLAYL
jgi:hypothetical protein